MAGNYRKPTDSNNQAISFNIEAGGQIYSGTLTPSGKPPAFGMPNAFVVRMAGSAPINISIYMGKWVMNAREEFVGALGTWIEAYYK